MAYATNMVLVSGTIPVPVIPKTSKSGRLYAKLDLVQPTKSGTMKIPVTFLDSAQAQGLSLLPPNSEVIVLGTIRTEDKVSASGTQYTTISIMGEGFFKRTPRSNGNGGWGGYQQQNQQPQYGAQQGQYGAPAEPQDETPLAF